jgi:hypothetical protein
MLEELVKAYEDYIKILGDELAEIVPLAVVHGWKSTRFEQGEQARKRIKELREYLAEKRR